MNKTALLDQMAKDSKLSRAACKAALDAFLGCVTNSLKNGQPVVLTGFGSFNVVERKERTGINPATGKQMVIGPKRVPKFRAGKSLKEAVV